MRKIILIMIMCCAFAARSENIVSASSASGHPQDVVEVTLSLANTDAVVAFQTDIPLGTQLEYVSNTVALNADRITNHAITAAVVDGNLRILAYSSSLAPFVGNEGVLLSFSLKIKNEPGSYAIDVSNSKLSDASGHGVDFSNSNGSVTILSPKIQLNTGALNYGHVPIRSDYNQTVQITNVGNEPLTISEINFNDNVFSCPSFAVTTLQAGNSVSFAFKFSPMVKGAVNALATIVSNSISGNATISLTADPYAVNEFHFTNVSGYCDSIVAVPMTVNNMENLIGFQVDLKMPTALEYVDFVLSERKADHVAVGVVKNDTLRLMAYSPSGTEFTGTDGTIGTLRVRLHGQGGYYYLNPFKAVLADALGENVLSQKYQGYVNIRSPRISGNSTLNMGSSPVTETVTSEYTVANNGNAPMNINSIVFDQPYWSVEETLPLTLNQYSNTTLHVSYSREQKGDFSATMKIYSNDPQNGLKNVALSCTRYEPNSLSMEADPFTLDDNKVAVEIAMDNYSNIVALQADFEYPYQDYSVAPADFELSDRFENHDFYAIQVNDSVYKILVFSMQNVAANDNVGVILNVTLHPIGEPIDQDYTVSVKNIVLSGTDGVNIFSGTDISDTFRLSMTQESELVQGWNWWSTYIAQDGTSGMQQLENSIGENGVQIKSQTESTQNWSNSWFGTLTTLANEMSYCVNVSANSTAELSGRPVNPSEHPITLQPNWNWIGYPVRTTQSMTAAMGDFEPQNNDIIKSQNSSSTYFSNSWFPPIDLVPGQGYLYQSNATENRTLTFTENRDETYVKDEYDRYWNNDAHAFADNLTIIAVITENGEEVYRDNFEVGAFVNGENRGSVRLQYFEPMDRYYAVITVNGEDGEMMTFGIVNRNSDEENFNTANSMRFSTNAVVGGIEHPYVIEFSSSNETTTALNLYPNPVNAGEEFAISIPTNEKVVTIVITDVVGNEVRRARGDVTTLEGIKTSGAYCIQAVTKSGRVYRGRVIVK